MKLTPRGGSDPPNNPSLTLTPPSYQTYQKLTKKEAITEDEKTNLSLELDSKLNNELKKPIEDQDKNQIKNIRKIQNMIEDQEKPMESDNTIIENEKTYYNPNLKQKGPFTVIIQGKNEGNNLSAAHCMTIAKILKNKNITGFNKISNKGYNKVGLDFNTAEQANSFIDRTDLDNWKTFIPLNLTTIKGIVKNIPLDFPIEELKEAESAAKILHLRRLTAPKRDKTGTIIKDHEQKPIYTSTGMIVITFEGKKCPIEIKYNHYSMLIETYIPPVIQCLSCLRFGHSAKICKSKPRFRKCGNEDHIKDECQNAPKCTSCGKDHMATSKTCEEYIRQKSINDYVARNRVSFFEAQQIFPLKKPAPNQELNSNTRFPLLPRRQETFQNLRLNMPQLPLTSHSEVVQQSKRKREIQQHSPGYDRAAHNSQLISLSPRLPSTYSVNNQHSKLFKDPITEKYFVAIPHAKMYSRAKRSVKNKLTSEKESGVAKFMVPESKHNCMVPLCVYLPTCMHRSAPIGGWSN
ncbi:unnamed protein product [Brassicogethes aeneus]|uniref:CCHC-type domain-containing protein n=1 Tax=Brassicogethes aeneus TaxID=1431903 RepID=A0A9P0BJL9_BRAAE|nr:unnamed protein product [Brassicogethes aeneus]